MLTLSVKQLAEELNIHPQTVYKLVEDGEIPHVRLGRRIVFRRQTIDEWLKEREEVGKTWQQQQSRVPANAAWSRW